MHIINPINIDNSADFCKYFVENACISHQMWLEWAAKLQWLSCCLLLSRSERVTGCGGEVYHQHQILRIHTSAPFPVRQSAAAAGVTFRTYCSLQEACILQPHKHIDATPVLSTGNSYIISCAALQFHFLNAAVFRNFLDCPCLINLTNNYICKNSISISQRWHFWHHRMKNVMMSNDLMMSQLHPGVPALAMAAENPNGTQPS